MLQHTSDRARRRLRRTTGMLAAGALLAVAVPVLDAGPASAADPVTFLPGDSPTSYIVPAGVTQVRVRAVGGSGNDGEGTDSGAGGRGGKGAVVATTLAVAPGQVISIVEVGSNGGGALGGISGAGIGGAGGGNAVVFTCSTDPCFDPVSVIAGGGGGGGGRGQDGPNPSAGGGASFGQPTGGGGFSGSIFLTGAAGGVSGAGGVPGPGGAGGVPTNCVGNAGSTGASGIVGAGGRGGDGNGGGGGGGGGGDGALGGGGGGGGGVAFCNETPKGGGGGGGAGSSLVVGGTGTTFATDDARSPMVVITPLEGTPDTTAPTVTVEQAATQADPTSTGPIRFTVTFSEPVEGFTISDVTVASTAGGGVSAVIDSGDHTTFTVEVSGMNANGTVTASVQAGATADVWGNLNEASTSVDNAVEFVAVGPGSPTVTVEQAAGQDDPTSSDPILFTATFSEAVAPLTTGDVQLSSTAGGAVTAVTPNGDNTVFTITVSGMTQSGEVSVTIPAGVTTDGGGDINASSTSTDNTVTFEAPIACTIEGAGDIFGTAGDDVICGSDGVDRIRGLGGNDEIHGFGGADRIMGDAGDDTLFGEGGGLDQLVGGDGDDTLHVGDGETGDYALGGPHVNGDTCVRDQGDLVAQCETVGDP